MSAPRKKRCEGEHGSRVYASGSCVWRLARVASLAGACAYVGVNTGPRTRYPFPVLLSHARVPPLLHVHPHARTRARARAHRCAGAILARARVRRTKRKIPGVLRGARRAVLLLE